MSERVSDTPRTDAEKFEAAERAHETWKPQFVVPLEFTRQLEREISALREQMKAEPVADVDGPDTLRISKSGFSLRVGWGDEKRIVAVAPGSPETYYRGDQKVTEQWMADAERLCAGWNARPPAAQDDELGKIADVFG